MANEDDDIAKAQAAIRRGGTAWVVHALGILLAMVSFFATAFMGGWALGLSGFFLVASGAGAIIGKRAFFPAWWLSFLLSWFVEDRLTQERIIAYFTGASSILMGLLLGAQGALVLLLER